jgi:CHAT domain-containing protein/uncharacterized protein HemY
MVHPWKQIVARGVLILTGLGTPGILSPPQVPTPQRRSPQLPRERAGGGSPQPIVRSFELLKEVGRPHSLAPNARHVYRVDLKSNQCLRATVQQGIDVQVKLEDPAEETLPVIDTPNGDEGEEPILLVASRSGIYRMTVSADGEHPLDKTYVIKSAKVGPSTPGDRRQAAALHGYYAARDLNRHQRGKEPAKVLKAFETAARSMDRAAVPEELRAYAWQELGILYTEENLWMKALQADRNAAALFHRRGMKRREANVLIGIGHVEQELLKVEESLQHFEQARALAIEAGAETEEATASLYLGIFYAYRAEVEKATGLIQRALALRAKDSDGAKVSTALNALGLLYVQIGENEKALGIYTGELQRLTLKPSHRAIVLAQMGNVLVRMGKPDSAFQYFRQAYDIQKNGEDPDSLASTLIGLGIAFTRVDDFRNAVDSYQKALKIYQDRKDLASQATVFMNIGWALGSLQRYEDARDSFDRALALAQRLKNPVLESNVLLGFAWVERLRGNLSGARRQAEKALERVEATRRNIADQNFQISYFAGVQSFYDFLIRTLMEQYALQGSRDLLERALQVSESARYRSLLDTLGESGTPSMSAVLTPRDIQRQVLDPNTVLLEYSLGEPKSYLFLLTSSEVQAFELPPQGEIEALAKKTHEALTRSGSLRGRSQALQGAMELSRILIGPVAGLLGNKRLLIVASGALHLVPLDILPDSTVPIRTAGPGLPWPEPLLRRHEIIYEPSAAVLAGIQRTAKKRPPATGFLAALGDAVFERDDPRIPGGARGKKGDASDPQLGYLERLPASRREVETITSGLPKDKILKAVDFAANVDLFRSGRLNDFRALHIATHTYYLPQHPEVSAMFFSRFDARGRARQGLLRIKDVSAMKLNSDLVVLSSCSSGLGREVRGEGVVGWPWAFLSAGASEVVMSLWNIGDKSTANFMTRFYEKMSGGASAARALRETKIQMWREGQSPWAWGGFVAQGEWDVRPLLLNKTPPAVSFPGGVPRNLKMTKKSPPLSPPR